MPDVELMKRSDVLDMCRWSFIRVHMFLKMSETAPTLKMAFLDPDRLKKLLTKNPAALKHARRESDDDSVVTTSTAELQAFMIKHGQTQDAWGSPNEFNRKGDTPF